MIAAAGAPETPLLGPEPPPIWLLGPAFLLGLASVVLVFAAFAAWRGETALAARVGGDLTVVTAGRFDAGALETSDAAMARAGEILGHAPGVTGLTLLPPDVADAAMARLLGVRSRGTDAGAPRFAAVRLGPGAPGAATRLRAALTQEGLIAAVDDPRSLSSPLARAALLTGAVVIVGLLGAPAALALIVGRAVAGRARRAGQRLDLLARLGARRERLAGALTVPMAGIAASMTFAGGLVGVTLVGAVAPLTSGPFTVRLDTLADLAAMGWLTASLAFAAACGWVAAWRRVRGL
jgi:cell division protein FtsX